VQSAKPREGLTAFVVYLPLCLTTITSQLDFILPISSSIAVSVLKASELGSTATIKEMLML
jgi:hypothetical protein